MLLCRDCADDLWHCHGTLVRHPDGSLECTDDTCAGVASPHAFWIACTELSPSCCADEVAAQAAPLARGA